MLIKILTVIITIAGTLLGYGVAYLFTNEFLPTDIGERFFNLSEGQMVAIQIGVPIFFGIIFLFLTPALLRAVKGLARNIEKIPTIDIILGTLGLVIGLIIAFLISQILEAIQFMYLGTILSIFVYILLGYLGIYLATQKLREIPWASLLVGKKSSSTPSKGKGKGIPTVPKILDTSVIIDGRIADIMRTGFFEGTIVIPEFVLMELQHIADSSDSLRRNRGRRGLDVLNTIQKEYGIEIYNTSSEKSILEIPEVDTKLLKLAQMMGGKVVTNDFNLNKVAEIKGVSVLNINELTNALKPIVLPGEDMQLFLVKEGKESEQAVAYLDDGTMIVVEGGRKFIGHTIDTTVTSVLQTSAGRMIFAKPKR